MSTDADWAQTLDVTLVTHEITDPREIEFATRKQAEVRGVTVALRHGAWFGAFVDSRVRASLGILTDGAGLGRFQSVETHPQFRRRGLARALLTTAAASAQQRSGARGSGSSPILVPRECALPLRRVRTGGHPGTGPGWVFLATSDRDRGADRSPLVEPGHGRCGEVHTTVAAPDLYSELPNFCHGESCIP